MNNYFILVLVHVFDFGALVVLLICREVGTYCVVSLAVGCIDLDTL